MGFRHGGGNIRQRIPVPRQVMLAPTHRDNLSHARDSIVPSSELTATVLPVQNEGTALSSHHHWTKQIQHTGTTPSLPADSWLPR